MKTKKWIKKLIEDIIKNINDNNVMQIRNEALDKINTYLSDKDLSKTSYNNVFKNKTIFEALK